MKKSPTFDRWARAMKDKAFDSIRDLLMLQTRPEHFVRVPERGTLCTNIFSRRLQNFALDMSWLPWPVRAKKRWPKIEFKEKRGITLEDGIVFADSSGSIHWSSVFIHDGVDCQLP